MPSTIDLRRRIRSVKNTQQITKAMKMVAAAKLRRAQERMMAARPYAAALREVLASISTRVDVDQAPAAAEREQENKVLLVVVTADRGLGGAFNTNIIRAAQNAIAEKGWHGSAPPADRPQGADFFKRRTLPDPPPGDAGLSGALARDRARDRDGAHRRLRRAASSTRSTSSTTSSNRSSPSSVTLERLLPLRARVVRAAANEPAIDYLYEPSPEAILDELLPKHIEFQLYRVLLESAAAEQGARMTAMESATKNASDMIATSP